MSEAARTPREQTSGPRLPRGPHSLTREQVAADQRRRLMAALVDVVAEKGYTATTIADVSARAGVSRKAFYAHFANKEACFLETYDEIVAAGVRRIARMDGKLDGLSAGARSSIGALLELAIENPNVLRLVMIEVSAVGPAGVARHERLLAGYEDVLRESLGLSPTSGTIPNPVLRAIVGGLSKVLYTHVQSGKHEQLRDLLSDIVTWASSYYPAPASMTGLRDPKPSHPPEGLLGGRAPGTLAPGSTSSRRRRALLRHEPNLSRSLIVHSQRERILDAVANLSASKGFAGLGVEEIVEEAGVSLKAFYEHFTDREDAFLVAYQVGHGKGLAIVERAFEAAPDWRSGVRAGVTALFDFLASEPAFAHLALVDARTATPHTAERSNRGVTLYAQMLMPGLEQAPKRSRPAAVTIEAIAGGIFELCFGYALQDRIAELSELVPRATYFALAPFVGAEEAGRIAVEGVALP
jgi:AcrR family transcriptional regulator